MWRGELGTTGSLVLKNTTVTNNTSTRGGGVNNNTNLNTGTAQRVNTIVSGNFAVDGGDCFTKGITSLGHNLVSDGSCGFNGPGDISGVDPLLGLLQNNGGATFTQVLWPGSPAIDGGDDAACAATDQRGVTRPQGAACDIGAYEK